MLGTVSNGLSPAEADGKLTLALRLLKPLLFIKFSLRIRIILSQSLPRCGKSVFRWSLFAPKLAISAVVSLSHYKRDLLSKTKVSVLSQQLFGTISHSFHISTKPSYFFSIISPRKQLEGEVSHLCFSLEPKNSFENKSLGFGKNH